MNLREFWVATKIQLSRNGVSENVIESELLIRCSMRINKEEFYASLSDPISDLQKYQTDRLIQRRLCGEPLAYILGHREFYGLDFFVNSNVLIPRQETELLVETILSLNRSISADNLTIADIGTGSGAIAIALAHQLPEATIFATDLSTKALEVADINRHKHGVAKRVHLLHGNLLEPLKTPVDIIVSNLPYLKTSELTEAAEEIKREPTEALDGGTDGLKIINGLLKKAPSYLKNLGHILIEISPEQLKKVIQICRTNFQSSKISSIKDIQNLHRVVHIETINSQGNLDVNTGFDFEHSQSG